MNVTTEITMTREQFHAIASLAPFASRDDATPVIQSVSIQQHVKTVTAYATDRYRVAEMVIENENYVVVNDSPLIVSAKAMTQFAKMTPKGSTGEITIRYIEEEFAKRIEFSTPHGHLFSDTLNQTHSGNYPPVARLFPERDAEKLPFNPLTLNTNFVASAAKLFTPGECNTTPAKRSANFEFSGTVSENANPKKPQPVLLTREDATAKIRVLIQPNLMLR